MEGREMRVRSGMNCKGGEFVSFVPPLGEPESMAFCDHNMQIGDIAKMARRESSGFLRQYFNAAGEPVARTFDWVAREYVVI